MIQNTEKPQLTIPRVIGSLSFYNADNLEIMRGFANNEFDLAIVDPPYGIGVNKMTLGNGKKKIYRGEADWDNSIPKAEYWNELKRVSKNQIVWGGAIT